ncbi:transposase [Streptomyces sp. NPDC001633]|uniref:transposase n=1 Tax=Streptomyces sp. NPDC001633 TaxID=3364595 RepID=UPI0036831D90
MKYKPPAAPRTGDCDRCRAAHIPDERAFAAKPDLAKAMVLRAIGSPLPIAWVAADSAYGQEWRLRRMLEEAGLGYVLAVPKSQQVPYFGRIDHLFSQAKRERDVRAVTAPRARGLRTGDRERQLSLTRPFPFFRGENR